MIENSIGIFGPPGTGKTHELISRMNNCNLSTDRVAVFSHSRAAAKELINRISFKPLFVGTLHSFCFHHLSLTKSAVVDRNDFIRFIGGYLQEFSVSLILDLFDNVHATDINLKDAYQKLDIDKIFNWEYVEFIYESYYNWKRNNGLYDFNDMIRWTIKDIKVKNSYNKFDYIFVDEAQDLSRPQWKLIQLLLKKGGKLTAAGDDDQSIFCFSGAWPQGMIENCEKHIVLTKSYRLPRIIWSTATAITSFIVDRKIKKFYPADHSGSVFYRNEFNMVFITNLLNESEGKILVLCRDKWVLKDIEDNLIIMGIPYSIEGGITSGYFTDKKASVARMIDLENYDIKKINNWLKPSVKLFFESTNKIPLWWQAVDMSLDQISYLFKAGLHSESRIILSTIHSQKGREADNVVLISKITKRVDKSFYESTMTRDAELRVWYVAATRAKKNLYIIGNNKFMEEKVNG